MEPGMWSRLQPCRCCCERKSPPWRRDVVKCTDFVPESIQVLYIQVVYMTSKRLWKLARETFAPVWSLSKLFTLTDLVIKSLRKIRLENIQNRRPHGSLIKHGGFWDFQCVVPLRMTRVQTLLCKFDESWVNLSDQCRNHDFEVLHQSINSQGAAITRRPEISTSYLMRRSSRPLAFRKDFTQINCSQSVKMEIWCCKEICQIYATQDICWYMFGY